MIDTKELVEKLKCIEDCWSREMKPREIREIYEKLEALEDRIQMMEGILARQDPSELASWKSDEEGEWEVGRWHRLSESQILAPLFEDDNGTG
jgi:hypothetical protein